MCLDEVLSVTQANLRCVYAFELSGDLIKEKAMFGEIRRNVDSLSSGFLERLRGKAVGC
jgi:hypothetical protein